MYRIDIVFTRFPRESLFQWKLSKLRLIFATFSPLSKKVIFFSVIWECLWKISLINEQDFHGSVERYSSNLQFTHTYHFMNDFLIHGKNWNVIQMFFYLNA